VYGLGKLYAECARRIAEQVYLVVRDEQIAASAVHEAFARAGARWDDVRAHPSPEGWVRAEALRIAAGPMARLQLSYRRLRERDRRGARIKGYERTARRHRVNGHTPVPGDSRLLDALAALSTVQVTALVLRHLAGLGPDRVALEMESTIGAAERRIHSAEGSLATAVAPHRPLADRQDIGRQLSGLAGRVHLPLMPPDEAEELPERRARRALRLTGSAAAALALVLGLAVAIDGGDAASPASAAGSRPAPATSAATPGRSPGASPAPTEPGSSTTPGSFIPERGSPPDVSQAPSTGKDFGYVRWAFRHGDEVYVEFDRARLRSGEISNVSPQLRIFPVAANASVLPARRLSRSADGRSVGVQDFLRLVLYGDAGEVPVTLRYDNGEIASFAEVGAAR